MERDEQRVTLDGSTVTADLLPHDAKTSTTLTSPGLDVDVAAVSVWDGVWYRTGPDDPWQRASLGGTSAQAGVDIVALEVSTSTVCRSVLTPPGPGGHPSVGGS